MLLDDEDDVGDSHSLRACCAATPVCDVGSGRERSSLLSDVK